MTAKEVLTNMTEQDMKIIALEATVAQQAKMIEHLRKDAELGQIATTYIERLCDPTKSDSLEKIVDEYAAEFRQAMSKEG